MNTCPGPLAKFVWRYSVPPPAAGHYLTSIFRDWHRGYLLGSEILDLEINGHKKTALDLERLNLWIAAHGAWRASALPYWEAAQILDGVLAGRPYKAKIGRAGGGRSAPRAKLEEVFFDGGECIEGVPLLQRAKLGNY